ncbi:MAG: phytanoyl-CoA dioxygenase family protein, partial [Gammaproteobacteria bacterium]|nr:phytanoyl-CoA dioxygenase family protein [Gammaproteobacteria bacterium]
IHGFGVAAFNLADSGPETGGLCCIPGSHNSHIKLPRCIRDGSIKDVVEVPYAPAGSVTFFSEATTHGTMEWKADYERRTLLYKYCASQLTWSRSRVTAPEGIELTSRQRRLLEEPAGAHWFFDSLFDEKE